MKCLLTHDVKEAFRGFWRWSVLGNRILGLVSKSLGERLLPFRARCLLIVRCIMVKMQMLKQHEILKKVSVKQ